MKIKKFWNNKRVFITGGSGFIGQALSKRLSELGARVYVLHKTGDKPGLLSKDQPLLKNQTIIEGEICDTRFIDNLFKKNDFEICFHLAAKPLVLEGKENESPLSTFEVNIMGTLNILEAVRRHKIQGLVVASTAHVYGESKLPFLERYLPQPSSPYETSKACADILAQTYNKYYKLPVAIARFVNIYGPGDSNKRIIPKTIQLILQNQSPELYDVETKRSYLHIDDAVNGYVTLAEKLEELRGKNANIIYNFGSNKIYSNKDIINKILTLMKREDIIPKVIKSTREKEIAAQYVSSAKAKRNLGWSPKISIEDGLENTIRWYRRQTDKK